MADIKEKIDRLELTLIAIDAPVLKHLNPGLRRENILEVCSTNNINPNPSLIALYEWHNGTYSDALGVPQAFIEIVPEGFFYTLDDMIRKKRELVTWTYLAEDLGDLKEYWPVFGSREDDLYLLKNTTGEVYYISPAVYIYGDLEFKSLDDLIDCVNKCYENGVFLIHPEKGLTANFKAYKKMRSKY